MRVAWSPAEDAQALDLHARGYSAQSISMLIPNRSVKSVYSRLAILSGGRITPTERVWNEGRIARAMELLAEGHNSQVAANRMGVSRGSLASVLRRMRAADDPRLPGKWRLATPRGVTHRVPASPVKQVTRVDTVREPLPPRIDRPTFPCFRCGSPGWCGHAGRSQPWAVAA